MERKILGKEKISLLSGEEREVNVYAVGYYEKSQFIRKHTTVTYDKGHQYKNVDELAVVDEILKIAIQDVPIEELDYDIDKIYKKYFAPDEHDKKEKTSTDGQTEAP